MNTVDQVAIREACETGRKEGRYIKAEMQFLTLEQQHMVQLEVASDLIASDGLSHSKNQGIFYEAVGTPLCFLRKELGKELTK